jgi:hypothetical protein
LAPHFPADFTTSGNSACNFWFSFLNLKIMTRFIKKKIKLIYIYLFKKTFCE